MNMKFKNTLLLGYSKDSFSEEEWQRIDFLCERKVFSTIDDTELDKYLADADCLLVKLGAAVDQKMMDAAPNLKYIGMMGTGYGRIDTKYATQKHICVCNISGYSTEGVAELAFGLILEHIREISRAKNQAKKGNYSESGFQGYEIKGKKFGVVGLGRIGQRIAEIAQGFGADVAYWSANRKQKAEQNGIKYKKIEDLLSESDFISLNLAFNPETQNFFDSEKMKLVKSDAVMINLAPMELVDITALEEKLRTKTFTFILDHSDELSTDQAKLLAQYENCIMYAPVGYITKEATKAKTGMFIDNLENFLKDQPTNKVN